MFRAFLAGSLVLSVFAAGEVRANPDASSADYVSLKVTFRLPGGHVYRMTLDDEAVVEDISIALDKLSPGTLDAWLNLSPHGKWLLLESDRFDSGCITWACLSVISADLSVGEAVFAGGALIHPEGFSAIGPNGESVVWPTFDGPHSRDLWVSERGDNGWSPRQLITALSPYQWNAQPAISMDGQSVVFDCGDQPSGTAGTGICRVDIDGRGFVTLLTPTDIPGAVILHHPDFAPDGSVVFEAETEGEKIWRLPAGGSSATIVAPDQNNDNSPCVLPDGRIVSVWLGRPGGDDDHELKVMDAGGGNHEVPLPGADVLDSAVGCGGLLEAVIADGFEE